MTMLVRFGGGGGTATDPYQAIEGRYRIRRRIEPTVAPPLQRLRAVRKLAAAGIRVGVAIAYVRAVDERAAEAHREVVFAPARELSLF